MERKIVLITGATSGIGQATAVLLARNGFDLIITGRRAERLNRLKNELEQEFQVKVKTLNFDIRNREDVNRTMESLDPEKNQYPGKQCRTGCRSGPVPRS